MQVYLDNVIVSGIVCGDCQGGKQWPCDFAAALGLPPDSN
jgi:hypothetical protein